jgi:general secretion pathway protein L
VHLKKSWGGIKCAASSEFPFSPPGVGRQIAETVDQVRQFVLTHKVKSREAYVTIPKEDVLFKKIALPAAIRDNLQQVLEYEFENYFPFSPEQALFAFAPLNLSPGGGGELEILISVVHRDRYEGYMEILHQAGLFPMCLESPLSARISLFQWLNAQNLTPSPLMVMDVDAKGIEIELCLADRWEWKNLRRSPSLYEDVKHWLFQFESLTIEQENGETQRIELPLLCLNQEDLPEGLADELGEYFPLADADPVFSALGIESRDPSFLYPFGAALHAFADCKLVLNFIPPAERPKKSRRVLYVFITLAAAFCLISGAWLLTPYIQSKQEYSLLQQAISELAGQVENVEKQRNQLKDLKRQMEPLAQTKKKNVLMMLKELTMLLPEDSWITNLDMETDNIKIRGNSENANALIPILEKSPLFKEVTFLSPLFKRDGKDVFQIQMRFEE